MNLFTIEDAEQHKQRYAALVYEIKLFNEDLTLKRFKANKEQLESAPNLEDFGFIKEELLISLRMREYAYIMNNYPAVHQYLGEIA